MSNEIICPKCHEVFSIDEAKYDSIVKQVHDKEFAKALAKEHQHFVNEKEQAVALAKSDVKHELDLQIAELTKKLEQEQAAKEQLEKDNSLKLENELAKEKASHQETLSKKETSYQETLNEKEAKIQSLENDLKIKEQAAKLDFQTEQTKLLQEIEALKNKLAQKEQNIDAEIAKAVSQKDNEIVKLQAEIKQEQVKQQALVTENQLTLQKELSELKLKHTEELNQKDTSISNLENKLQQEKSNFLLQQKTLEEINNQKIKHYQDEIAAIKDFKQKYSTKMLGESLEQHCEIEFNKIRTIAFPTAYFEKDNDISKTGTKGDYIYRESTDGIEFISIMFEMKNEADTTATKKHNEDFFAKLDKDRKAKNCEYAVLVSLLDTDDDYYNNGIVDVSYKYEKMYVIRPQFFIPLITMLRNANLKTVGYRKEVEHLRNCNIDITNFETAFVDFKEKCRNNYELSFKATDEAIKNIDAAIKNLLKVRDNLKKSDNQLRLATNKVSDFTIKKLIKDNPTMNHEFAKVGYDPKAEQKFDSYKKNEYPDLVVDKDEDDIIEIIEAED